MIAAVSNQVHAVQQEQHTRIDTITHLGECDNTKSEVLIISPTLYTRASITPENAESYASYIQLTVSQSGSLIDILKTTDVVASDNTHADVRMIFRLHCRSGEPVMIYANTPYYHEQRFVHFLINKVSYKADESFIIKIKELLHTIGISKSASEYIIRD